MLFSETKLVKSKVCSRFVFYGMKLSYLTASWNLNAVSSKQDFNLHFPTKIVIPSGTVNWNFGQLILNAIFLYK